MAILLKPMCPSYRIDSRYLRSPKKEAESVHSASQLLGRKKGKPEFTVFSS